MQFESSSEQNFPHMYASSDIHTHLHTQICGLGKMITSANSHNAHSRINTRDTLRSLLRKLTSSGGTFATCKEQRLDESGVDGVSLWMAQAEKAKDDVTAFCQPSGETLEAISKVHPHSRAQTSYANSICSHTLAPKLLMLGSMRQYITSRGQEVNTHARADAGVTKVLGRQKLLAWRVCCWQPGKHNITNMHKCFWLHGPRMGAGVRQRRPASGAAGEPSVARDLRLV
jgi:hypothetical protein